MTETTNKTRLDVLKEEKEAALKKIDEGIEILNETEDLKESKNALATVDEQIKICNKKSGEIYLEEITAGKSALDIMKDAILNPRYETYALNLDKEIGVYKRESRQRFMPLENVHGKAKGGIGVDKNWIFYAYKLNYLIAVMLSEEIISDADKRKKVAESYEMKDAVRAVLFPQEVNPLKDVDNKKGIISKKNTLAAMRYVISAMIGEEYGKQIVSYHVGFLTRCVAQHDKKKIGVLKLSDDKQFVRLLLDICHIVMTGESFSVESKNIKSK